MNTNAQLKALANPYRWKILHWLRHPSQHFASNHCNVDEDGVCVGLIEKKVGLSQSTVSQYLRQLHQAGLIELQRRGQWTFCKLHSQAVAQLIAELESLV